MTMPRRILPDETVLVTRRCARREFLLVPSAVVTQVFTYCLAHAATLFSLEVHAVVVMSNHYHLVCTDPDGRLPEFCRWLHGHVARALNLHHGRAESLWAPGSYSRVVLGDEEALVDRMAYVVANPVAAGLVEQPEKWPGLIVLPGEIGTRTLTAERPSFFFRQDAPAGAKRRGPARPPLPATASVAIALPPAFAGRADELHRALAARVAAHVTAAHAAQTARGRPFLGRAAVLRQDPRHTPATKGPEFALDPRVAGRDRWARAQRLQANAEFLAEHRHARETLRAGKAEAVFPAGTYWHRVHLHVRCRGDPQTSAA